MIDVKKILYDLCEDEKVYDVSATITGVIKQMKRCKQKISEIYEKQVNFNRQTTESSV